MGKTTTISTAKTAKDVDKAYASAVKAVSMLGIKVAVKKPDMAKLEPMMKSSPAVFQLIEDGQNIKVAVEAGSYKSVLGIHNVMAEKDMQKLLVTLKALDKQGMGSFKKEIAEIEKKLKGGPDPKVIANIDRELEKSRTLVANAKKEIAELAKITNFATAYKSAHAASVQTYCKKTANDDMWNCLTAIAKKQPDQKIIDTFIKEKSPQEMNLDDGLRDAIVARKKPVLAAYPVIDQLFAQNVVNKWRASQAQVLKLAAAPYEKRITELEEAKKKALKG